MQKINIILIIMVLTLNGVSQGIFRMDIQDLTGDNYKEIQVMQNNNISTRWVKTVTLNESEPITFGVGIDYHLLVTPTVKTVRKDITGKLFIDYVYHNFFWIIGIIAVIISCIVLAYKVIKQL